MPPARLISPEMAFTASLKVAQRADSQGRATITKAEAEKALKQLEHPQTSQADKARIVKDFLEGAAAKALSPKAKEVLADFVKKNGDTATGTSAAEVKAAARDETGQAERNIARAQEKLEKLIGGARPGDVKAGLQQVRAWLDAAAADVLQAKEQVMKLAKTGETKTAHRELTQAQKELGKAADDVAKLLDRGVTVKKSDLEAVRGWLAGPLPELTAANNALGFERVTRKFPSDAEDAGGGGGEMVTRKFPSDNEDGGGNAGGGGGVTTMKAPSDLEDGGFNGGGPGGGFPVTMKAPSDNEDGGGNVGGGGGVTTMKAPSDLEDGGFNGGGPGGGLPVTMKAPSDNEDGGGGGIGVVTEKHPSDNEDGGGNVGGGGGVTTMKAPSDLEDGGFNGGGPGGGLPVTMKAPSDNEDGGGGGGIGVVTEKHPSDNEDGGGGGAVTAKFPSDNEDGGAGGGGGGVERVTRKFPSDNEDGGGNAGGGGAVTAKFPSDNEDGQGGGQGPDIIATRKHPSDNEDGGVGEGGGGAVTAKFPSDNEDGGADPAGGGGGGWAVTLKYPSDHEDGGGGGGGGVFTTMKAPSDAEDGGGGGAGPIDEPGGGGRAGEKKVTPERAEQLRKAFNKLNTAGTVNWQQGGAIENAPLGQRFARVELMRERHPDGYTYTAFIPVGALTPTAPGKDPNKVKEFYIERTGGIAGLTQSAGPFNLPAAGGR